MDELQPGDKVVEMGAMVRSVTVATGAVSAAVLFLLAKQGPGFCILGFFLGAIAGLIVGAILSRLFYADGKGKVSVVKATPANIPVALSAASKAVICQTACVLIILGSIGRISSWPVAISAAVILNSALGFVIARLSLL